MSMFEICKLNQKTFRIPYSQDQLEFINRMPQLEGHEWDGKLDYTKWRHGDGILIKRLKVHIYEALEEAQGLYCAYCGQELRLTSDAQIEHIAPKGRNRYPQFMFHPSNLTLACAFCNGFEKKEKRDHWNTIGKIESDYEDCYFNIVHPYLDDPSDHYNLGRNAYGIIISHKSLKGQKSITVFKLDEERQTNARGRYLLEYQYIFDPRFAQAFEASCALSGISKTL